MKALTRDVYGSPDVLEIRDVPTPAPQANEVLVRVRAASINDWDWGLLQGPTLPIPGTPPKPILGSDIAGTIVSAGSAVTRFRPGDDVYGDLSRFGSRGWGGFAEYATAPEQALVPKPARMSFEQAAALPQAGQLAVQGLFANGPLRRGQKILINGAGGGVGTIGVQLAKAESVEVTGVDRASKFEMMRGIGFDHLIDFETTDFTATGRRYDLIVDTRTNRMPPAYLPALSRNGVYATVGGPTMRHLFGHAISGWAFRLATGKRFRLIMLNANRDLPYLNERFEANQLVPVIDGPYSLSQAREAFRRFGAGQHLGKIVFTID